MIELVVVLAIIALIAGLVVPRFLGRQEVAEVQTAETQVKMLRGALLTYRLDIGQFPTTAQGLNALMAPPQEVAEYWKGPYLNDAVPLDPWRTPYRYEFPADTAQGYALYSLGADKAPGGEGFAADVGLLPARAGS